MSGSDKT
jgi:large subunit ribosomal protein L13e